MSGRSATLIKSVPEICVVSGGKKVQRRTVLPWGADGLPVFESFVPETLFVSGGVELLIADGPHLGRGRSARDQPVVSDTH